jgi:ParB family chromosome partitioning protein
MNIQHSSRSDEWFTPPDIIQRVRQALGGIDLDPASCAKANEVVGAGEYYDADRNGLVLPWHGRVFCNPPGGKVGNRSKMGLFWDKLLCENAISGLRGSVFLCFSLEAAQSTQQYRRSILDYPFCVPAKRVRFVPGDGGRAEAPSHSNAIVYVPGSDNRTDAFVRAFDSLGKVVVP